MSWGYSVRRADWVEHGDSIRHVRYRVFVQEQHVPLELEKDGLDAACHHVLAQDGDGAVIGTGRMEPRGKIGRMAVLREHRRRGVGADMLKALLAWARELELAQVGLHAQQSAVDFYAGYGFEAVGEPFDEAGIPHLAMRRAL